MNRLAANLRVIGALAKRAIRQTYRRPQMAAPILIFPTLFLALNTGGAGRAVDLPAFPDVDGFLDFQLAASLMQSTMMGGLVGGIALAMDIETGFSDRLMLAPISRFSMVLGRLTGAIGLGVVSGIYFLAVGLIFGASVKGGVPGVLLVLAMAGLSAAAFGAISASLALKTGRVSSTQGVFPLVFVVLFLSSAFFPEQLLLEPARTVSEWNPFSFVVEGMRDPVISDISLRPVAEGLAAIVGVIAFGIALSALALRSRLRGAE